MSDIGEEKLCTVVAFISVYESCRAYGGPEEGGWYYDHHSHAQVAVPFLARQRYVLEEVDRDTHWDENETKFYDGEGYVCWRPVGVPEPVDQEDFNRQVDRIKELYKVDDVVPVRGDAYMIFTELRPGRLERDARPRYE